jgi:hypothetical protein
MCGARCQIDDRPAGKHCRKGRADDVENAVEVYRHRASPLFGRHRGEHLVTVNPCTRHKNINAAKSLGGSGHGRFAGRHLCHIGRDCDCFRARRIERRRDIGQNRRVNVDKNKVGARLAK